MTTSGQLFYAQGMRSVPYRLFPFFLALTFLVACEGEAPDYAGAYMLALTSGENECRLENWQSTQTLFPVSLDVLQQGDQRLSATFGGEFQAWINGAVGGTNLSGKTENDRWKLELFGNRPYVEGSCVYTINVVMEALFEDELLSGEIRYRATTNGSPNCGTLRSCENSQRFNGARP